MNVGVVGTCLSNLTAAWLMSDFGWKRLNNAAVVRSDLFISQFIEGSEPPPLPELQAYLGVNPEDEDINRYILENYRYLAGMTEISPGLPGLWKNLHEQKFDVLLLDNLSDINGRILHYKGDQFRPFDLGFALHLGHNSSNIASDFKASPHLTPRESAEGWLRIVNWLQKLQPAARLFFTSAQYCTAVGDPGRYDRAIRFHNEFIDVLGTNQIEVISPIVVPFSLTKLPNDRDHFDMSVYRAIAGHVHITALANWSNWTNTRLPSALVDAPVDHDKPWQGVAISSRESSRSLRDVIAKALGLPVNEVTEQAAMYEIQHWDSLKQIAIVLAVEEAFGVRLPFEATTSAGSIAQLRQALGVQGVIAADHEGSREFQSKKELLQGAPQEHICATTLGEKRINYPPIDWAAAQDGNLFATFARRACAFPDAPFALFVKDGQPRVISNQFILSNAAAFGNRLSSLNRGAVVAIVLNHSPHLYTAFIGCVLAGLVPTILSPLTARQDPDIFRQSMEVLFDRTNPGAVITSNAAITGIPQGGWHLLLVDEAQPVPWAEAVAFAGQATDREPIYETAFLQHSSGTTGHKKGVMLDHAQVLEQVRLYSSAIDLKPTDRIASWLPLYHDMGLLTSFIIPTILGCPIISLDAIEWVINPTSLLQYIELEKANYCWLPNFAFLHIANNDRSDKQHDLRSIKMFINCSEPCRVKAFDVFLDRYSAQGIDRSKLQVCYAMAENVFAITQTAVGEKVRQGTEAARVYLSSGRALPGVQLEIRSPEGVIQPEGSMGEICLKSTSMFSGYLSLPDLTEERIQDGWYHTRDLGFISDSELYIVGRTDDLIIVNGKNIVAHEIEDDLATVIGVVPGRILVVAEYNEESGSSELIVLAELNDGAVDIPEIRTAIHKSVYSFCSVPPSSVHLLPRGFLIKSTSGKLARSKSVEKFKAEKTRNER